MSKSGLFRHFGAKEQLQLATVEAAVSELAGRLGMSKSGLFRHFGAKEQLQLATVEAAVSARRPARLSAQAQTGVLVVCAIPLAEPVRLARRPAPTGSTFGPSTNWRLGGLRDPAGRAGPAGA